MSLTSTDGGENRCRTSWSAIDWRLASGLGIASGSTRVIAGEIKEDGNSIGSADMAVALRWNSFARAFTGKNRLLKPPMVSALPRNRMPPEFRL